MLTKACIFWIRNTLPVFSVSCSIANSSIPPKETSESITCQLGIRGLVNGVIVRTCTQAGIWRTHCDLGERKNHTVRY
ncbi:hypothetical protein BGW37DRAFT_483526 [Umbelopsis sp. PMI_123]|nr:hypothetical protein BGW37DRAFT_483526 [Umbelopsis sp. PMI_123]